MSGGFQTLVNFTNVYAQHPTETGLGAWRFLKHSQRAGQTCIDCGQIGEGPRRFIGWIDIDESRQGEVYSCQECYEKRLIDHIDHYRPQSPGRP